MVLFCVHVQAFRLPAIDVKTGDTRSSKFVESKDMKAPAYGPSLEILCFHINLCWCDMETAAVNSKSVNSPDGPI